MKKEIFTTLFILTTGLVLTQAQGFEASTYMEKTFMNPKLGTSLGYEFKDKGEIGGFYQRVADNPTPENGRPVITEEEFYGMYMAYPLFDSRLTDIKFNVRTGVSNGENFVITPSVLANFHPTRLLTIGGGLGTRAFRPTLMASISLNLGQSKLNDLFIAQK